VDRQHRHLLEGGRFGEAAVAAAAARFRELLRKGRTAELERELRPGTHFALQVQALARVGTAEAGGVLERQLSRRLSQDPIEQTWYWADAASGLRQLRHAPALPALLRCADTADSFPAGAVLAAEVVAFPNFLTSFTDLTGPLARPACRAVVRVARACREGAIAPEAVLAIGLGDLLAQLGEAAPPLADPWLTLALIEAERLCKRIGHWARLVDGDASDQAARQARHLRETSAARVEWLRSAPARLIERFSVAHTDEQLGILRCLLEFRAEVISLFPHLPDRRIAWWPDAVRALMWSQSVVAGPVLARQANKYMSNRRYRSHAALLLATLRGHPCPEAEQTLLRAATSSKPSLRLTAVGALGWWPPYSPVAVLGTLRTIRTDQVNADVRQAAVAALARLGVRSALDEIRTELMSEEPSVRASAAERVAAEGLSWLWPDLQELAEHEHSKTALVAVEAIEQLREQAVGLLG
jgi:hypothetical protein